MARGTLTLLLVLTVGCIAPPLVISTGGALTTGPRAEELVREAGVVPVVVLIGSAGNGIWVGENKLLSIAHVAFGSPSLLICDTILQAIPLCNDGEPDGWVLLEATVSQPPKPCAFPIAETVHTGQDILLVGYMFTDAGASPVTVAGKVIDPAVFHDKAEANGWVCADLGLQKWEGLSGAAVLVRDGDSWKLAGVMRGWMDSERGEIVSTFVTIGRLPDCMAPSVAPGH
jgi:hypothetical protein